MKRALVCTILALSLLINGCAAFDVSVNGQPVNPPAQKDDSGTWVIAVILGVVAGGAIAYAVSQNNSGGTVIR